jgi:cell division protein FtsB
VTEPPEQEPTAAEAGPERQSEPESEPRARRSRTRLFLPVLASLLAMAFLFIGVFPTRALLAQRSDIAAAQATLDHLEGRNDELGAQVEALGTDAEIERIAREQYHFVFPGEEAYAMLPAPPPTIPVPQTWPFAGLHDAMTAAEAASP